MKVDLRNLPKASLDFVEPMLAKPVDRLPTKGDWLYEVKLDGYRALVIKKRTQVKLFSRRGNILNRRFPTLSDVFDFLPEGTVIDGEIVVLDHEGKPSFSALQNSLYRASGVYFYAFDVLAYQGKDLRRLPLSARRELLELHTLKDIHERVRLSVAFKGPPKRLVAAAKRSGLEGVVAKRIDSHYEAGERSGGVAKIQNE